jgi:hypothetical protein
MHCAVDIAMFSPPLLRIVRSTVVVGCVIATSGLSAAEDAKQEPSATFRDQVRQDLERVDEFFDTRLPGTLARFNVELKFTPKFGDFRDNEFVRYPFELRYGLSDRTELYGGMSPYHPNPFNNGRQHKWGLGESQIGVRYNFGTLLGFYDESTFGLEVRSPLGKPPIEIIDAYSHLRPSVTAARKLKLIPDTSFYTNYSYDREVATPNRDTLATSKMHIAEIGPGLFYKPNEFGAFAEYRFQWITTDAGTHHAHNRKVGVLWDVPLARTQKWKLPGKWRVELAYKFNHETGFDDDRGFVARVSWRTSLREVLDATDKAVRSK